MPTCDVCGLWIDDDAEVCPECGAQQDSRPATIPNAPIRGSDRAWKFPRTDPISCGCLFMVLAFIAVLNLPKVRGAREAARRSQCKNNLKEIGLALRLYHNEYGSF